MSVYLVTGAAGFLGRSVVRQLVAEGHAVRAMVQRPADAAQFDASGATPLTAELLDARSLAVAVAGVEIVCHCAAKLPGRGPPDEIWTVNVDGTANLLAAAVTAGVRRFVYVSTDSVYGDAVAGDATEESPLDPTYLYEGDYPRSKLEGEKLVRRAAAEHGLEVAILRPCLMYGPGSSTGTDLLRRWADKRVHLLIGGGECRISMGFVTDVAAAVVLAAQSPAAIGRAYNVSSGEPCAKRQLLQLIAATTGRRRLLLPLPGPALLPVVRGLSALSAPLAPRLAAWLDPRKVGFALADHVVDIGCIRRELGYAPRVGLPEGLRRTFAAAADVDAARGAGGPGERLRR